MKIETASVTSISLVNGWLSHNETFDYSAIVDFLEDKFRKLFFELRYIYGLQIEYLVDKSSKANIIMFERDEMYFDLNNISFRSVDGKPKTVICFEFDTRLIDPTILTYPCVENYYENIVIDRKSIPVDATVQIEMICKKVFSSAVIKAKNDKRYKRLSIALDYVLFGEIRVLTESDVKSVENKFANVVFKDMTIDDIYSVMNDFCNKNNYEYICYPIHQTYPYYNPNEFRGQFREVIYTYLQ